MVRSNLLRAVSACGEKSTDRPSAGLALRAAIATMVAVKVLIGRAVSVIWTRARLVDAHRFDADGDHRSGDRAACLGASGVMVAGRVILFR